MFGIAQEPRIVLLGPCAVFAVDPRVMERASRGHALP